MESSFREKVLKSLDSIRPTLQFDGGDIELVEVDEKERTVSVRLRGACVGCMGAAATLQYGVTAAIKRQVPEIKEVKAVG